MSTVAELLVKIGADTSELKKEIAATKRQLKTAFGSDGLSFSNNAISVLEGIGVAIGALGVVSVKAAGELENVKVAMTNMLGSAEQATEFVKELQDFAAHTPFEFSEVTKASQRFLAFGFSAEQILPTLTAVGDAAAGVGAGQAGISRLTIALGQIAAKGKLASQEMMQVTELGIPAWQMLAEKLGTDVAGAQEMVGRGLIDSKTALEALVGGMEQAYGGMMEQQSKTILGTWSNLIDGLGQTAAQVGLVISESMNLPSVFSEIGDWLSNFAISIENSGLKKAISECIPPGVQLAVVAFGTALVGIAIPAMVAAGGAAVAMAAPFVTAIGAVVSAAAPFVAAVTALSTSAYALYTNGVGVADVLSFMGVRMELLSDAGDGLQTAFASMGDLLSSVLTALQPLFIGFATIAGGALTLVARYFGMLINAGAMLLEGISFVVTSICNLFSWLAGVVGTVIDGVASVLSKMADAVLPEWASKGIKSISGFVGASVGWLDKLINKVTESSDELEKLEKEEKKQAPKQEWKLPDYKNFAGNLSKTATSTADKLEKTALRTSKSIEKEWVRTFQARSALVDRWYKEETAELEKSKAANENYERDKERLAELYAQKRINALHEEAKAKEEITSSIRDASYTSKNAEAIFSSNAATRELLSMQLEHEKTISAIEDRWRGLANTYIGLNAEEKAVFIAALKDKRIGYELTKTGELNFHKQVLKDKLAADKEYAEKSAEYYTQAQDIKANVDKAFSQLSYAKLKSALNNENMTRLAAASEAETIMRGYYDAKLEAHQSFNESFANSIISSKEAFQTFFTDVLAMSTSFMDGLGNLLDSLLNNIVSQLTAGWAASISSGLLGSVMGNGKEGDTGGADTLSAFTGGIESATLSMAGLTSSVGGANSIVATGTGLLGAYNTIESVITTTTKPAEGAAITTVTAALVALSTAATSASIALSAMSASGGLGFGFFAKGGLVKMAGGGSIKGAGTGTSDSIPAMLSNGEYVIKASTVSKVGVPFLNALNNGEFPGYATGGIVEPDYSSYSFTPQVKSASRTNGNENNMALSFNVSAVDAESFTTFLERGGLDAIRQALFSNSRNFGDTAGVW